MTTTQTEDRLCACGCGQPVIGSRQPPGAKAWKRGHKLRSEKGKLTALPGPEDDLDGEDLDAGEAYPDDFPFESPSAGGTGSRGGLTGNDVRIANEYGLADDLPDWLISGQDGPPAPEEPEITADRPPGRLSEPRASGSKGKARGPKVTATLRKDVEAKIRFVLMPAGQFWAMRDAPCGGTFVQQEPAISEALAEIVCDSPDLLAWFTGPAGGFMKYFKLAMALLPVGQVVVLHHMTHATLVPAGDPQQPPQQQAYAA